jgi:hypothetical protein
MVSHWSKQPLIQFLRDPFTVCATFDLADWETLMQAARRANLLSRIACIALKDGRDTQHLPTKVCSHLNSALRVAESNQRSVLQEVRKVRGALAQQKIPVVLLKGAAYIAGEFPPAPGRLLSDIDIMVPVAQLDAAEREFVGHGWMPTKFDAYDQRYYRHWMHELPPLRNIERGTSLDVHHSILPPTAALKPDINKLWERAVALPSLEGVFVLSPEDMVLHSATHLFHDGELENGLRDLVDIDALIRQFAIDDDFANRLVLRSVELNLARPLFYALRYCKKLLATPFPIQEYRLVAKHGSPGVALLALMDVLVTRSIGAVFENAPRLSTYIAKFSMYVRSHYLRMPLYLLIPHLIRKQLLSAPH